MVLFLSYPEIGGTLMSDKDDKKIVMPLYLTDNGQQVDIFVLRILVQGQLPNLLNALILMLLFLNPCPKSM